MVITSAFTGTGDLKSLSAIIGSMAQKDSMELRVTILSAVLDTPIFCPRKAEGNPSDPGALSGHLAIDLSPDPNAVDLSKLYRDILRDHSLLLKAANELNKPLSRRLVELTLLFIEELLGSRDQGVLLEHREYPNVLPSIAWPSQEIVTEELIPARKLAVKLFARLWTYAREGDETKKSMSIVTVEAFTGDVQLRNITKAVEWFADHHVGMELDCISLWIDRLPEVPQANVFKAMVEAFKRGVVYVAFSDPEVEDKRLDMFVKLSDLKQVDR
ncbi:hypothetical protein FRC03_004598 [Tulasnella sp. 419]|nr:hypothetical protein FRC03_004598 [Tulasnella sp. 419]